MTFLNLELNYEFGYGLLNWCEQVFSMCVCVCVKFYIYIHITYKFHTCTWNDIKFYIPVSVIGCAMKFCNLVGPNDVSLTMGLVDSIYQNARESCESCVTKKIQLAAALKKFEAKDK